jgi:hypothetical protein
VNAIGSGAKRITGLGAGGVQSNISFLKRFAPPQKYIISTALAREKLCIKLLCSLDILQNVKVTNQAAIPLSSHFLGGTGITKDPYELFRELIGITRRGLYRQDEI